ncbi:cupin domain-containing protein [Thermus sp. LT1-2-5]|uniref:cupin domain-containing protein n=1 Tax=Thermus sp. LT1-2-5 TaxID=3026935 RepID=UPI00336586F2
MQRVHALVPATGQGVFRRYPQDGADLIVPQDRPFAAKGLGETPLGTTLLIRTRTEQPLHYHRERLEVAFVLQGQGRLVAGGKETPITSGQIIVIPPMTAHAFIGELDLLSRFSPRLMGDVVFVQEGSGPQEGAPLLLSFKPPEVPQDRPFAASPLANAPLATVLAVATRSGQPWHYHKSKDEQIYVLGGQGIAQVELDRQKVGPGSVVLVPAGAIHQFQGNLQFLSVFSPALMGDVVFL